jgi:hypothetical protein
MHAYIHTYIHIHIHTYIHTAYNEAATLTIKKTSAITQSVANTAKRVTLITHTHTRTHTQANLYIHMYTHAYIHTYSVQRGSDIDHQEDIRHHSICCKHSKESHFDHCSSGRSGGKFTSHQADWVWNRRYGGVYVLDRGQHLEAKRCVVYVCMCVCMCVCVCMGESLHPIKLIGCCIGVMGVFM